MISSIKTHIGKVRLKNEDFFYAPKDDKKYPMLFIVADGMGGHRGGDTASRIAVEVVSFNINNQIIKHENHRRVEDLLHLSINKANNAIYEESLNNPNLYGMGTTLTLGLFFQDQVYIGHVGDSRAYRIRGDFMQLLTRDHSLIWQLMEEGKLSMEDMSSHPMKNVITKFLGTDSKIEPDIDRFDLKVGDILVLCTDGLVNMLEDSKIMNIVANNSPEKASQALIDEAISNGGTDNITVGVIKVDE